MATLVAELETWRVRMIAFRTYLLQISSTLTAEHGAIFVLELTFRALHHNGLHLLVCAVGSSTKMHMRDSPRTIASEDRWCQPELGYREGWPAGFCVTVA